MKKFWLITLLALLVVANRATAQQRETYGGAVEVMDIDENNVTFSSVGTAEKDDDVLVAAEKNLFQKILFDGVENFNDDKPLVERYSPVLESFFHAKYQKELLGMRTGKSDVKNSLAYRAYVVSSKLEGQPKKNVKGQYEGTAIIEVNQLTLGAFLRNNKVILDGDTTVVIKENVKKGRPSFIRKKTAAPAE